jgi:hypothetical protein
MLGTARVRQSQIRQLYRASRAGLYDRDLLNEVGWALHARCAHLLETTRATRGEVPCPHCGEVVLRPKQSARVAAQAGNDRPAFHCPGCDTALTWEGCKQAALDAPRCFTCRSALRIDYSRNELHCPGCERVRSWRSYRASVRARTRLFCPQCDGLVSRPRRPERVPHADRGAATPSPRKQPERLCCCACGYQFTWAAWRRQHRIVFNRTGNPLPVQGYWDRWPCGGDPAQQSLEIDALLHAMHIRGSLAHLFLEGDEASVRALLDHLASQK